MLASNLKQCLQGHSQPVSLTYVSLDLFFLFFTGLTNFNMILAKVETKIELSQGTVPQEVEKLATPQTDVTNENVVLFVLSTKKVKTVFGCFQKFYSTSVSIC